MSDDDFKVDAAGSPISWWQSGLFLFGAVMSIVWLAAGIYLMNFTTERAAALEPNDWGDVFAGLFAPVAFLWLVLGFIQQGRELQFSTQALRLQARELNLQARELRNSVEQQKALVKVATDQLKTDLEDAKQRQKEREQESQPRLVLRAGGNSGGPDGSTYEFVLSNHRAAALNTRVVISPIPRDGEDRSIGTLLQDRDKLFTVRFANQMPPELTFRILYDDINGTKRTETHVARTESDGRGGRRVVVTPILDTTTAQSNSSKAANG